MGNFKSYRSNSVAFGFLHYVECTDIDDNCDISYDELLYQFYLLQAMYPEFPAKMMKTLLIRERGNAQKVTSFLKSKGWKARKISKNLTTKENRIFSINYYWGNYDSLYSKQLKTKQTGSYFTTRKNNKFYLYYKKDNKISKKHIKSPKIKPLYESIFSLDNPLKK